MKERRDNDEGINMGGGVEDRRERERVPSFQEESFLPYQTNIGQRFTHIFVQIDFMSSVT